MPAMAALECKIECKVEQDAASPKENGDALSEEKSLSIDYSEDLWLANSEDSSGPYAQQPNKVVPQEASCTYSCQSELRSRYSSSFNEHQSADQHLGDGDSSEPQIVNSDGQLWSGGLQESEATTLQPAVHYMNGFVEQNGIEFQGEEGRDFAQMVPAGTYLENGGVLGLENQDKTFTSLMPAAAMEANEEQGEYSAMIGAHQRQIVYYGSGDHMSSEVKSDIQDNVSISYSQSGQMAAASGEESESGEVGSNSAYISVEGMSARGQSVSPAGSFTVLSPAMIRMSSGSDQTYASQLAACNYQHISTLPFVQNSAYSTQTSYHSAATPNAVSSDDIKHHHLLQQSDHSSSDHTSFSSADPCASMTPTLQASAADYLDEEDDDDDDQDDDTNQDMDDENSGEFSELSCPVCNEAFPDHAALQEHVANHPQSKTFLCGTCDKGFATRRYLKYHRKNHCKRAGSYEGRNDFDENDPNGGIKKFTCNVCNRLFRVLKCMKVHKKKKHGILKEYTCHNCAVTFSSLPEHSDHSCKPKVATMKAPQIHEYTPPPLVPPIQKRKKKLKNAKPTCDICGKTFSDRISVDIHRVKHIEEELYPCDMCCDEEDKSNGSHLAVHFRIRFFTDDNQHILDDQRAAVTSHDQSRSDEGSSVPATPIHNPGSATPQSAPATPVYLPATPTHTSVTPICHVNSINLTEYTAAMNEQHAGDNQAGFTRRYADFSGIASVESVQTYSVSTYEPDQNSCPHSSDQSVLMNHQDEGQQQNSHVYNVNYTDSEVIHDASGSALAVTPRKKKLKSTKTYLCDICNKSFGDTSKLELHYKSNHLNDRPYQCDVCEKSFFTKWKLQRHMLSHLEQKPHSCPMCSKSFVERGKLEAHYRTHLGTKPYKCDQCPKTFTVKSQLSIHQRRIHSTDQPFGCLVCGKAFLWKSGLDKHMRKHTREKPYICEKCGIKYSNKANLIVHMSKAHNQKYVDKQGS